MGKVFFLHVLLAIIEVMRLTLTGVVGSDLDRGVVSFTVVIDGSETDVVVVPAGCSSGLSCKNLTL